ncbi:MAG TPA: hypothetical protein VFA88_06750 [Gaiellaceae bacterium]|nr:hypothetical protein [Gaiellaceae bacterium]
MAAELRGLDPAAAARLVVAVGAYRALHGSGPSWRQAARAAGWRWRETRDHPGGPLRSDELADRMHALRRAGLITFTREPRSLAVTPAGRRWALATLAHERAQQMDGSGGAA